MTWKLAYMIFTTKDIKKEPMWDRKEDQRHSINKTYNPGELIHKLWQSLQLQKLSPRKEGVWVSHGIPQSGGPALGRQAALPPPPPAFPAPDCLALNASMAYFWEIQGVLGKRNSTLKGANKTSHTRVTQGQSSNLKISWLGSTCWSWRGRGQRGLTLGTSG